MLLVLIASYNPRIPTICLSKLSCLNLLTVHNNALYGVTTALDEVTTGCSSSQYGILSGLGATMEMYILVIMYPSINQYLVESEDRVPKD